MSASQWFKILRWWFSLQIPKGFQKLLGFFNFIQHALCPNFKQLIRHPFMNGSASLGVVGSSTISQKTREESHRPVHSAVGK